MNAYLGLDLGSTTVKAVLLNDERLLLAEPIYLRSTGWLLVALSEAIARLQADFQGQAAIGITGSGRETARQALELPAETTLTEICAHAAGAWEVCPSVRTIVDIGGQDSKLIRLQSTENGSFSISDFMMNELCAAGTGAFLEMHATELGFSRIEDFAEAAALASRPSRIAGRCSVLAQSDIVHLRQKGENLGDIAAGLCHAVVRNVLALAGGKPLAAPVLFQGGVASNAGVVKALRAELAALKDLDAKHEQLVIVPPHHNTLGAWGAAVHASNVSAACGRSLKEMLQTLEHSERHGPARKIMTLPPLLGAQASSLPIMVQASCLQAGWKPAPQAGRMPALPEALSIAFGLDVGSASVKIAALDR